MRIGKKGRKGNTRQDRTHAHTDIHGQHTGAEQSRAEHTKKTTAMKKKIGISKARTGNRETIVNDTKENKGRGEG